MLTVGNKLVNGGLFLLVCVLLLVAPGLARESEADHHLGLSRRALWLDRPAEALIQARAAGSLLPEERREEADRLKNALTAGLHRLSPEADAILAEHLARERVSDTLAPDSILSLRTAQRLFLQLNAPRRAAAMEHEIGKGLLSRGQEAEGKAALERAAASHLADGHTAGVAAVLSSWPAQMQLSPQLEATVEAALDKGESGPGKIKLALLALDLEEKRDERFYLLATEEAQKLGFSRYRALVLQARAFDALRRQDRTGARSLLEEALLLRRDTTYLTTEDDWLNRAEEVSLQLFRWALSVEPTAVRVPRYHRLLKKLEGLPVARSARLRLWADISYEGLRSYDTALALEGLTGTLQEFDSSLHLSRRASHLASLLSEFFRYGDYDGLSGVELRYRPMLAEVRRALAEQPELVRRLLKTFEEYQLWAERSERLEDVGRSRLYLASLLEFLGREKEAEILLESLLRHDTAHGASLRARALYQLARLSLSKGDAATAEHRLREAAGLTPDSEQSHRTLDELAWLLLQRNEFQSAIKVFERIADAPSCPAAPSTEGRSLLLKWVAIKLPRITC